MKRRDLLSAGALGVAGAILPAGAGAPAPQSSVVERSIAALLPLRVDPVRWRVPIVHGVRVGRAFPDPGASEPGRISLELALNVDGETCRVACWEQVRLAGAVASPAAGVFMPFVEGRLIDLHVTLRKLLGNGEYAVREWRSRLAPGTWLVAAQRRSTGVPPLLSDLRIGSSGPVELRDGKPVDFDSVLLVAL